MPRPSLPRRALRGVERLAVPLADAVNQNLMLKAATRPVWRFGGKNFVTVLSKNLYELHFLERLHALQAPAGLVLVTNHRSFFDLFFTAAVVIDEAPHLLQRMVFPVRKDFFYDNPAGVFINVALTSASMWPPIFRDERRGEFNQISMAQLGGIMQRGTLCGIHPEGTRGRGPDPYELGPAKPGLGQLVLGASPELVVLPAWILGMSNDFLATAKRNFKPRGSRGEPVRIWFGEPLQAAHLIAAHGQDPLAISRGVMKHVAALGDLDREDWQANPRSA